MTPPTHPSIRDTRHEQLFPRLAPQQLATLMPLGERRTYSAGAMLFREGERHLGMFVVLAGLIEIVRRTVVGEERVATYGPGMFTGDVSLLTGRAVVAGALVREDAEILVINEAAVHRLMVTDAELSELMMRAFILRRVALLEDDIGNTTLIGSRLTSETHRLRQFLIRNGQPHTYLDLERDTDTAALLQRFGIAAEELPVAITGDGQVLRRPTNRALADAIGLSPDRLDGRRFDVAVIGAGPAGLAAAVYAASEGLSVVVLDIKAPGGQAGTSSKIENYFGFPTGISGQALAGRGFVQAQKFGAEVAIPREVTGFECAAPDAPIMRLDGAERVAARVVVIATGARYRKPALTNLESFEGRGVYYAASFMEAQMCAEQEVIVVGGGNSAGQAAVFLAAHVRHVHMLVRSTGLAASMSDYLIQRIAATGNVTLRTETEIVELSGESTLSGVRWRHRPSGLVEDRAIEHVFLFLGAEPNTAWLQECVTLDAAGFVRTGPDLSSEELDKDLWPDRLPMRLETSHPGVFAVGDVRSGSVKRVAAAVGEGSTVVQLIHLYLAAARR